MKRLVRHLPLAAYAGGAALLTLLGPALWDVSRATAATAAGLTALLFAGAHLAALSRLRARRLAELLDCQDELLRNIIERMQQGEARIAALEACSAPDAGELAAIKASLRDLAATLGARAGATRSAPVRDAGVGALARAAVEARAVELHLQPIVRLTDRSAVHAEALARLRSPKGEVVLPAAFLPEIEAAGLSAALDDQGVDAAISAVRDRTGCVFYNLSRASLADRAFMARLVRRMAAAPELAGRLAFEIAARDLPGLGNAGRMGLGELTGLGFALSIDGLQPGSGAEHALPGVRFAKVDADALVAAGLSAVVELREAGIEPVALRVETEAQTAALARAGVRLAQGYLFGRPEAMMLARAA